VYNYRGGVYRDTTNDTEIDHDVEVVGWGEDDDGTPYWNVRNSWGADTSLSQACERLRLCMPHLSIKIKSFSLSCFVSMEVCCACACHSPSYVELADPYWLIPKLCYI